MRVLSLDVHGFKSFAQSTRLEFDDGVAGIVGPNGSGKSNVVEAVRWVLGEQSYSQLRGKRTEDVIWSGTKGRAAAGMAEVSITFDNADRFLPIEYAEVTITRRAYRSGENEYMINRSRVRLRDIIALVSAMGQGYTVVSQGTADAALSLTPENRRSLFEEAADITQHYARRDETLRRFTEMQTNATRVGDLLSELAPRLRALSRQARQAREREAEEQHLRDLQLAYYSRELARSTQALHTAREELTAAERSARDLRAQCETLSLRDQELRQGLKVAESDLSRMEEERALLSRDEDKCRRTLREAEHRAAECARELAGAESRHTTATAAVDAARKELQATTSASEVADASLTSARQQLAEAEQHEAKRSTERKAALAELDRLRAEARKCDEDTRQQRELITTLSERLDTIQADQHTQANALEQQRSALDQGIRSEQVFDAAARSAQEAAMRADAAVEQVRHAARRIADEHARLHAMLVEARADVREKQSRLSLLSEMHHSGAGLNRGAQTVVRASAKRELTGIVGTLGSVIAVPERLEPAVESVLGAALQNVVTRRWADAEQAIALLKRSGAGRVTFLPLDTLRPPTRPSVPAGPGIIGIAAELVDAEPDVRPALIHALGRVLIVEDLLTARSTVQRMGGISAVVTLGGETLRPGGSLTGGAPVRESGMLAREREIRDLPSQIEQAQRTMQETERSLRDVGLNRESVAEQERRLQQEQQAAIHDVRQAESQLAGTRRQQDRLRQQEEWLRATVDRTSTECETLQSRLNTAQETLLAAEKRARVVTGELQRTVHAAGASEQDARDAASRLVALRTSLAVAQERARSAQAARTKAQATLLNAEAEWRQHERVAAAGTVRTEAAQREARESRERLEPIQARLRDLDHGIEPARVALRARRQELDRVREESAQTGAQAAKLEEGRIHTTLRVQRAEDAHVGLRERAARETGNADIPDGLMPPDDVEERIRKTTDRLARIGPVNALAAREHDEIKERAAFLERQLADIQTAQNDLQTLIGTIEEQMERRFTETFSVVSQRFGANFARLFNGGTAQLALISKGDTVGVEIQAQPPGKRLGNLSLLSGGERALTSCALLFALIQAGGAPFCVLDEVDAALDESNVGRFCDLLEELARDTQFIVVTHNRGTIERASRLYGVSMEASGISKVLSLQLEEVASHRATA